MDDDVVFESTRTLTQAEFADWVVGRERWDHLNRFELLDGRVVMTPPAGHPHGEVEANVVAWLHALVRERGLGRVFVHAHARSVREEGRVLDRRPGLALRDPLHRARRPLRRGARVR